MSRSLVYFCKSPHCLKARHSAMHQMQQEIDRLKSRDHTKELAERDEIIDMQANEITKLRKSQEMIMLVRHEQLETANNNLLFALAEQREENQELQSLLRRYQRMVQDQI